MIKLADHKDCTGCSACANACHHHAISMTTDGEGFLMPEINADLCVECKLCEKSCPITNPLVNQNTDTPKAYAVWNEVDRKVSSSGGAFSSFARRTIAQGGVVFGAAFDSDLHCHHIKVTDVDGLDALRGSKYVQSNIGNSFAEIRNLLRDGVQVLFCGTPCQVAGLKAFLRNDYENLLTLDLACHGVPSDALFQAYRAKISTRFAGRIDGFEFRRRDGWGKAPSISVDGKFQPIYGVDSLYMNAFDKNAIFRQSCYHCPFAKVPRIGDCTLADFWGIGRYGKPFRHDVMKGVSLVLVNNPKGQQAIGEWESTFVEERLLDEALRENHNLSGPSVEPPHRAEIIAAFLDKEVSLEEVDKRFGIVDRSLKAVVKEYASRWHLFEPAKRLYNFYKSRI